MTRVELSHQCPVTFCCCARGGSRGASDKMSAVVPMDINGRQYFWSNLSIFQLIYGVF